MYLLGAIIVLYSVLFHVLMDVYEQEQHSWLTGFYWTLTVMSTLGFGDITFDSDIGRAFSILVMVSGVILLLIMLPFAFIRFFYAPWLEAQIRAKAPRRLSAQTQGHVIICKQDSLTNGLVRKLKVNGIPYCIIEPDVAVAARMREEGYSVVAGEVDDLRTYEALNIAKARLLLVNHEDPVNTNILLTVRSLNKAIPIIAIASEEDSVDIFSLSGATYPLPLKIRLGEYLATRVGTGQACAHEVGRFKDLVIVEFLVHDTPFVGKTLKEIDLRGKTGVNVVGIWRAGRLNPVRPEQPLDESAVPVAIGSAGQVEKLNRLLGSDSGPRREVLVIGGGKVGCSTARYLRQRGVHVRLLDRDPSLRERLEVVADAVTIGDAADIATLKAAGIEQISAVALTTNDDAQNIHLAVYCRRLRPDLNIVSRLTRERNIDAIYRAGADFVLSYASLGCEFVAAYLLGREPVMVGEGADFFSVEVGARLAGKALANSEIGAKTGLVVIAVEEGGQTRTNPGVDTVLNAGSRLLMLGTNAQREAYQRNFA